MLWTLIVYNVYIIYGGPQSEIRVSLEGRRNPLEMFECTYVSHSQYSNFRKYATPPDEKRCIIMEKSFLCSLEIFA